jgi:hypothetical protein
MTWTGLQSSGDHVHCKRDHSSAVSVADATITQEGAFSAA